MLGNIIECIAGNDFVDVVAAAGAVRVAGMFVEVGLIAGEADVADIGHAEILFGIET